MFNMGFSFVPFLTPLVLLLIVICLIMATYKLINRVREINKDDESSDKVKKSLTLSTAIKYSIIYILIGFLTFAFFGAYGPKRHKIIEGKQSGYMKILDNVKPDTSTKKELAADANEKRDVTGYLEQVGNEKDLKAEEEANAKVMDKYLK